MKFKNKWRLYQSVFFVFFLVIIFFTFPATIRAGTINASSIDGLVGYWTMDIGDINWTTDKVIDRSGNGNTGTLVMIPPSGFAGKNGQAIYFGLDSGVSTSSIIMSPVETGNDGKSVSVWVKRMGYVKTYAPLVEQGGSERFRLIFNSSGRVCFGYDSSVDNYYCSSNVMTSLNQWYYITAIYNGSVVKIYIDGIEYSVTQSTGSYGSFGLNQLNIGFRPYTTSVGPFNGLIDDVRVYNRSLSPEEVQNIYTTSGLSKISASSPTVATSTATGLNRGLVGYWTMDGGDINWTTNQTVDHSGNGNTGTLSNLSSLTSPSIGKIGQALSFDGVDDYVLTSNLVSNFSDETVTASVWFKANNAGVILDELGQATPDINWHDSQIEILATGEVKVRVWSLTSVSLGSVNFGEWHHVVLRYNKTTSNLDGFLDGVESVADVSGNRNAPWENGRELYYAFGHSDTTKISSGNFFAGLIDDMRIYNRALSNVEVQELYNLGEAKISASSPTVATSTATGLNRGLMGYWTMDGGDINWTTNQIVDHSGNGNTGTLSNLSSLTSPSIGKIGQALKFSRGSGLLQKINSSSIIPGVTSKLTLSAWVKPASYPSERFTIIVSGYYLSLASDGSLQSYWQNTSPQGYHSSGANTIPLNKWSYVVSVWDGSYVRLYVDGVLKKTTAVTGNGRNTGLPCLLYTSPSPRDGLLSRMPSSA